MMIAAAHLTRGMVPTALPGSDEPRFDMRYRGRIAIVPEPVFNNTRRTVSTDPDRRLVAFTSGSYRVWDNTRLIEIEPPAC